MKRTTLDSSNPSLSLHPQRHQLFPSAIRDQHESLGRGTANRIRTRSTIPFAGHGRHGKTFPMGSEITPEYRDSLRRMTGAQKLRTAALLYWGARKIKAARLRQLHPDWTEDQIQRQVVEIFKHATT